MRGHNWMHYSRDKQRFRFRSLTSQNMFVSQQYAVIHVNKSNGTKPGKVSIYYE